MPPPTLTSLLKPRSASSAAVSRLLAGFDGPIGIEDLTGKLLAGQPNPGLHRSPIELDQTVLGVVIADRPEPASAVAALINYLLSRENEHRALSAEVLHLYREVNVIERLAEQLTALLDLASVGQSALHQARQLIAASQACVLIFDAASHELRPVATFGVPSAELLAAADAAHHHIGEISEAGPHSLLCVPLRAKQRSVGVIALANPSAAPYFSRDLKLLNSIALQTAAAIENALLCAEMVDAVRNREQLTFLQKELDTARAIQLSLIPRVFPPFPDRLEFDLHAQMTAARSVGGDFFDFFLIEPHRLGIVIGDVSGKGIPSALFMAVTRTLIKTIALEGLRPEQCLREVNRALVREKASSMYATCFYGILNTRTGAFQYCNGGHNPPFLVRASGEVEADAFASGGLPLGLFEGPPYTGATLLLEPGDCVFLYTDGVPEANNLAEEEFGEERLTTVLHAHHQSSCRAMIDTVSQHLAEFSGDAPQFDDITMLALRLLAPG
ncbi:MAG: SpoIIE family protein phosphatase [Acidobacteria bacterium]|nr:SpoIIE family protein phosphatase [Acidobacteriota bacterium]